VITINLARPLPRAVLALGGETKSTLCCAAGSTAWISTPLADLGAVSDYDEYQRRVCEWPRELGIVPAVLAHDLHPEYISTKTAARADVWPNARRVAVQHHHAHIAACAAAEGVWDECWGIACDGTGLGDDGTLWGGEILRGSITAGFTRVARMRPMPLIGGAAAIREPWRIALALARAAPCAFDKPADVADEAWRVAQALYDTTTPRPLLSSSVGRLFDGVAAMLGLCTHAAHEAQAAMALEHCAADAPGDPRYELPCTRAADGVIEFDWRPMLRAISAAHYAGEQLPHLAARFHDSVAGALAEFCAACAGSPRSAVCGGGVFFNKRFTRTIGATLARHGAQGVMPRRLPPSDAGISLGQAVLAAARPQAG